MSTKALQEKASRIICSLFKKSDLNRSQYFSWYSRNYNKRCWIHWNWGPLQNYPIHQNYFQWILLQSVTHVRGIFLICKLWTSAPELRGNGPFSALLPLGAAPLVCTDWGKCTICRPKGWSGAMLHLWAEWGGAAFSAFLTSRNEIAKRYQSHCTKSLESTQTNWWYCDLLEFGRQTSKIICVTFRKNLMLRCVFCPRCQTAVWQKWQKLVLRNIWEGRGVGTWNQASHQT